jgi:SAM-dependent methyltransferase
MVGELRCLGCSTGYPIAGGIPRFAPVLLSDDVLRTVRGFGYEWLHAAAVLQHTRFTAAETFLDFINPVQPEYFKGKAVLDAGCGFGRFTCWAQQFGASYVLGVDLSESVEAAFQNTRSFPNVLIIQADLFFLPLREAFDYVFSIGVLDHTPDPRRAFDAVVSVLKPGGSVSAWVYGREGNGWIIYLLNPIRRNITSRLPRGILLGLSYTIGTLVFLALKGIYRPLGSLAPFRRFLFYRDYLLYLSNFGLREQTYVVFDQLSPTIAEYICREDFAKWFEENELLKVTITARNGISWRGYGVRPVPSLSAIV